MPRLIIDDIALEVPTGTKVIAAAERLGIMIPRFCYHEALGSVGACRLCAVKFLEGPVKGIQMSCMVEAQDGMVVSTTDPEAVEFRRYVIEWLMLNHPHDCPVCDEGGHCLLQDETISGGHGLRRFQGAKRTYRDQYLGPLVQHEMNRCIHCYRCSRFYQDYAGYRDLGPLQIANRVYFGRFREGTLESPFAGNLIDICPTGVFTDKPSRFKGRRWDYERTPIVCVHCALGCNLIASARYREIVRVEARYSPSVNGHFICDRGRYGFAYTNHPERPRQATVEGRPTALDEAIAQAAQRLARIESEDGPAAIACVGSPRSSLDTLAMLKRLCRRKGWRGPAFWLDSALGLRVRTAVARLAPELAVSLGELATADAVLVVGADPINEAPMLALALRQAQRGGASITVLDPRPVVLPFDFAHLPLGPSAVPVEVGRLIRRCVDRQTAGQLGEGALTFFDRLGALDRQAPQALEPLIRGLSDSRRPVIVCGTEVVDPAVPGLAADLAKLLRAAGKQAGLFYVLPGANAFGAGLLADGDDSLDAILTHIERGAVRGLVLTESDPFGQFPDRPRLEAALAKLEFLLVLDYLPSAAVQAADIFLPTTTLFETGGEFVNQEGRLQASAPAYRGGSSIALVGGGAHPPRVYRSEIPGADPRAAWRILAAAAGETAGLEASAADGEGWGWMAAEVPGLAALPPKRSYSDEGRRLTAPGDGSVSFDAGWIEAADQQPARNDTFRLIHVEKTFGSEELSAWADPLQALESGAGIAMNRAAGEALGLRHGDTVRIRVGAAGIEGQLLLADNMAADLVVVGRTRKHFWQALGTGVRRVAGDQITKVT